MDYPSSVNVVFAHNILLESLFVTDANEYDGSVG